MNLTGLAILLRLSLKPFSSAGSEGVGDFGRAKRSSEFPGSLPSTPSLPARPTRTEASVASPRVHIRVAEGTFVHAEM